MSYVLEEMYRQSTWANLELIEACVKLSDEQLDATAQGTYGSVRNTLWHLLSAEERYIMRLSGEDIPYKKLGDMDSCPDFPELRKRAQLNGERFIGLISETDPHRTFTADYSGQSYDLPFSVVLVQAINHGTEHRTQIKTILTAIGVGPPEIDGWTYASAVGQTKPHA